MKKNFKLAFIALLIVALSLCALLTACSEQHEHSYTELGHDKTNHWYYCAEDQEVDETSVQAHKFEKLESDANQHWKVCTVCGVVDASSKATHVDTDENGKCDVCQHSVPVPIKYGTISGTINLHKAGTSTPAGNNQVVLTLSDDKGEVEPLSLSVADGAFSFTAVEGEYSLKASVEGYIDATFDIELAKASPVTDYVIDLQYNLLTVAAAPGYDGDLHDFAHQNDENGYVVFNSNVGGKTLDFTTVDTMDDAMFTWYAKSGLSFHADQRVGVWAMFDDNGTPHYAWFTLKGNENVFEWLGVDSHWNIQNALPGLWGFEGNALSADEIAQYQEGTLQVGIARHQNMLFAIVNGQIRDTRILPEKYATMDCRLGMAGFDAGCADGAAKYYFSISTDIEKYLPTDTFTVTVPTVENLTITPSRTSGHKGQGVDFTFQPASGYSLVSVKVNEVEKIADLANGVLSIANYNGEEITAQVVKNAEVTANVAVSGIDGATLTFTQGETTKTATVTDGVATFDGATGIWEAFITYQGTTFSLGNLVIDEDGAGALSKTEIKLFNDKDILGWNKTSNDAFNVVTGKGELHTNGDVMMHTTSVTYGDVAITMYLNQQSTPENTDGVFILFGDKYVRVNIKKETVDGKKVISAIEWNDEAWMHESGHLTNIGHVATEVFTNKWQLHTSTGADAYTSKDFFTAEEQQQFANGELKLTLVRHGKMVYVFLNDKYIGLRNVGDALAETPVNCGLAMFGVIEGYTGNAKYAIETDISSYLAKCEGDSSFKYEVIGDNVTVTGKTDGFKVNDLAEISFQADYAYTIISIEVDGETYDVKATDYKVWVNSPSMANVKIEIKTALNTGDPVDASVTATGLDGATLTFTQGETTKTAKVTDGIAAFDGATGAWDVTVDYQGKTFSLGTVVVGADGTATLSKTDVKLFNDKDILGWNKTSNDAFNVVTGKGELHTNGDVMMHTTSVGYDDVAITMYLNPQSCNDNADSVFLIFGDKYVRINIKKETVDGKKVISAIEWNGEIWMHEESGHITNIAMSTTEVFAAAWQLHTSTGADAYNNKACFTAEEQQQFANGELKLTLVRHGKMVYVFLNDKYIGLRNVGDALAETPVNCGLALFGVIEGYTGNAKYAIETDISSYLAKCEGDATVSSSSEHVTVVTPADVKVNSLIDISFNVDAGYVITEISVDGRSYDPYQKSIKIWVNRPNFEVEITAVPTSQVSELEHNRIGDVGFGKADGSLINHDTHGIVKTTGLTALLENTRLDYLDGAFSVTYKKSQISGTAGVGFAFGGGNVGKAYDDSLQKGVIFRIENQGDAQAKVQWYGYWWGGFENVNEGTWDIDGGVKGYTPLSEDLYNAYANGDGITITVARIGDTIYALVNGTIVSTQYVEGYTGKFGRFFIIAESINADQEIHYQAYSATEAATLIANAKTLLSGEAETPVRKVIGSVGYTSEGGITFDGSGVAEVGNGSLNESLTISIGAKYAGGANVMGIMYRFANGKFLFIRSQKTDGGFKVQFAQDTIFNIRGNAHLQGWKDFEQTDEAIINSFMNDSLNLTLERDGNVFTVKLGDTVLDTITLGEEYATMAGQMMIDVQNGNAANAFTFTYADNSTAE